MTKRHPGASTAPEECRRRESSGPPGRISRELIELDFGDEGHLHLSEEKREK